MRSTFLPKEEPPVNRSAVTKLAWASAWIGGAFWSLFALVAYATVDMVGTGASSYGTVPGFPPEPFTFAWIAARLHGASLWAVGLSWLAGLGLMFGSAALVQKFFGGGPALPPGRRSWGSSIPSGPQRSDRLR